MSLQIKVYDVEHGSCTHIITPNNQHILFDLGRKANKGICEHLKTKYFKYSGTIDYLFLTHLHEDHIKDLPQLDVYGINPRILNRPKEAFDLSYKSSDTETYKEIVEKANQLNRNYNQPVNQNEDSLSAVCNGGVQFKVFVPDGKYYNDDPNTYSRIIVLDYAGFKFILTGDNPATILSSMLDNNQEFSSAIKDATVLLAPHHGRDGQFCENFVGIANPRLTVFSDGIIKYNSQEYAAQKYRNKTRGVKWSGNDRYVFTTRKDGTISFEFKENDQWSINTSKDEY